MGKPKQTLIAIHDDLDLTAEEFLVIWNAPDRAARRRAAVRQSSPAFNADIFVWFGRAHDGPHPEPAVAESSFTLVLHAPFTQVQRGVTSALPSSLPLNASGPLGCVEELSVNSSQFGSPSGLHRRTLQRLPLRRHATTMATCQTLHFPASAGTSRCADCDVTGTIEPSFLAGAHDGTRLEAALVVRGQAGLSGALAQLLALSGKNFEVRAVPSQLGIRVQA